MSDRIQLRRNPVTEQWEDEAERMGVPTPRLLTADLVRLRGLLLRSLPDLTEWEWGLLSHVMPDEGIALATDPRLGERIVSGSNLATALQDWAADADEEERSRAATLARRALTWIDVERWALMVRRRSA